MSSEYFVQLCFDLPLTLPLSNCILSICLVDIRVDFDGHLVIRGKHEFSFFVAGVLTEPILQEFVDVARAI